MSRPLPALRRSRPPRAAAAPQRLLPLIGCLVAAVGPAPQAWAQASGPRLNNSDTPVQLTARELTTQLDQETRAIGDVELRQGGLLLTADSLRYLDPKRLVIALGQVRLSSGGDMFSGTEAQYQLDDRTGFVEQPDYYFARTNAGGHARRITLNGPQKLTAYDANYTSCTVETDGEPGWELRMDRLDIDFDKNEGRAEGAVLRFLGVPILAFPAMTFPASDAAKSGWLPPSINIDSRAGLEVAEPYYWRIAPNYDLSITPVLAVRRGSALRSEFRYLQPDDAGRLELHWLPHDRTTDSKRYSFQAEHEGSLASGFRYDLSYQDASDDRYWKDFSRLLPSLTPRLLPQQAGFWREWPVDQGELSAYARVQGWRTLQDDTDPITVPYQRAPQIGAQLVNVGWQGLRLDAQVEANRFTLNDRAPGDTRPSGNRAHMLAAVSRPFDSGWGWITPKISFNAAAYDMDEPLADGRTREKRLIPTTSIDSGLRFERDVNWFGTDYVQTLEPRLHYVNTPFREQTQLPLFDTAASDFNSLSIYADNEFTGVDRVSDANQATLGATTRWIEPNTGVEQFRLGIAQRFLFRDQQLRADGNPSSTRVSDVLLFAAGRLGQDWRTDTTLQYNPDLGRTVRSIISMRYNPAPFHTISGTYRYARSLSEQFELGYQWPIFRGSGPAQANGSCQGSLYAVGRVNYSTKDKRLTDAIMGLEYDAGCWIARVVAERVSTGQSEATNRLMLQLELVGLSRLGSNPLQVLKDNIPGYRLLRDDNAAPPSTVNP